MITLEIEVLKISVNFTVVILSYYSSTNIHIFAPKGFNATSTFWI